MRKYILATHGQMAYGMNTTLNMLIGEQENLTIINAYTEECKDPVPEFEKIIEENPDDDIIIMTDLFGGSVNNNAMLMTKHQRVHVVTGINLAIVISIVMSDSSTPTAEMIREAVSGAKDMIIYCNDLVTKNDDEDENF
jgi:mannose/fructose-specific phosphotransferase system component IIA